MIKRFKGQLGLVRQHCTRTLASSGDVIVFQLLLQAPWPALTFVLSTSFFVVVRAFWALCTSIPSSFEVNHSLVKVPLVQLVKWLEGTQVLMLSLVPLPVGDATHISSGHRNRGHFQVILHLMA